MNLGVLPSLGGSLSGLAAAGQAARFLCYYLPAYCERFERVTYFSYRAESLADFTDDPALLARVCLVAPPPGASPYGWSAQLALRAGADLRACSVLRVLQLTGAGPALAARARWHVPYVVTYGYHYAQLARMERRWRAWLLLRLGERPVLARAAAVIVTTPALREHVARFAPPERIHLIPNGVDTALFSPAVATGPGADAQRPGAGSEAIFVGRLEPQKNLSALLEAIAALRPEFDLRLTLVGQGTEQQRLEEQARGLNVPVRFAGPVPNEQLPPLLQAADLFVLPSLLEGHPKALLEAMSVGLPCVGADAPGVRDVLVDGQTGFLAPGTDGAALALALRRALRDPGKARGCGQRARRWVEREAALEALLAREVALLAQVAAEGDH